MPYEPITDPKLGIPAAPAATHRLVSIGDSLTHGFAEGAEFGTDLSCSAIVAHELGWSGPRYPASAACRATSRGPSSHPRGTIGSGLDVLPWADEVAGPFGSALPF